MYVDQTLQTIKLELASYCIIKDSEFRVSEPVRTVADPESDDVPRPFNTPCTLPITVLVDAIPPMVVPPSCGRLTLILALAVLACSPDVTRTNAMLMSHS